MNTLRRALCLALAALLLLSAPALAANGTAFTDRDEITHIQAVETLTALNVIHGKEDGSFFDPDAPVTRAELAKMICVALGGGMPPVLGGNVAYSFPDIATHWAADYIEYCFVTGIAAGRGNGAFDPNGTVTGTEAAKMLLVALGYQPQLEGFVGSRWSLAVDIRANEKGLYRDLEGLNPSAGLSRDAAAQMVYNALGAVKVRYEYQIIWVNGNPTTVGRAQDVTQAPFTLLEEKFQLVTQYGYLTGTSYNAAAHLYTYTLSAQGSFGGPAIADSPVTRTSFSSSEDFSRLFGQKVRVLYKEKNGTVTLYGIYPQDSSVLLSGVLGSLPALNSWDTLLSYGGASYSLDSGAIGVYVRGSALPVSSLSQYVTPATAPFSFDLIDNDGDGAADCVLVYPFTIAQVTHVAPSWVTVGSVAYSYDDCDIYQGIAKGDTVVITAAAHTARGRTVLSKAETVSGVLDGAAGPTRLRLNGVWYTAADGLTGDPLTLGERYTLTVANGYIFHALREMSPPAAPSLCLVTAKADGTLSEFDATATIQLLFPDGTRRVVEVSAVDTAVPGTPAPVTPAGGANAVGGPGTLYTYTITPEGFYCLTGIRAGDYAAASVGTGGVTITEGRTSQGYRFADDAVVFYYDGASYQVTTGAAVKNWAALTTASAGDDCYYAYLQSGFRFVSLAFLRLTAPPAPRGTLRYGWIVSHPVLVMDGSEYRIRTTIWTGSDYVTCLVRSTASSPVITPAFLQNGDANVAQGTPVSFLDLGDGSIGGVTSLAASADAVTAYLPGGSEILFERQQAYRLTASTQIFYVDTAGNTGFVSGSPALADVTLLGTYVKNCYVLPDPANPEQVAVLFVDTRNNLASNQSLSPVPGGIFAAVDRLAHTLSLSASGGHTAGEVAAAALGWPGAAAADVVASPYSTQPLPAAASVADGQVLRVAAADGSYHYFVISLS